ncbi:MAG: hypothetical protein ACW987_16325 [Candidatus Thorarchaeota archaeon]|jgi:hypothetical protein
MAGGGSGIVSTAGSSGGGGMGAGGWGALAGGLLGGIGGYLGGKNKAGPWDVKRANWTLNEGKRLYGGAVMAPMFRMMMFNRLFGKKGGMMGGLMNLWAQRYGQYNPGGNPWLGGGGYLGAQTQGKSFNKYMKKQGGS